VKNWYTRVRFEATCEQQVIADTAQDADRLAQESAANLRRGFMKDVYVLWSHVSLQPLPAETKINLKESKPVITSRVVEAMVARDDTFIQTDAAITQRILDISARDLFGFETMDLVSVLPFEEARRHLKPNETSEEWKPTPRDRKSVIEQMRDYMTFALEKATDHRGLSAMRSVSHFLAWLFLLGDDALVAFAEDGGNYKNYGMPVLKAICDKYQFAFPVDEGALNMASGKPCHAGCEEGCG
jgi:hypothetical protein